MPKIGFIPGLELILSAVTLLPAALLLAMLPQSGTDRLAETILDRYADLSLEEQMRILARAEEAAEGCAHPIASAVSKLHAEIQSRKISATPYQPTRAWSSKAYAPALKLKTQALDAKSSTWQKAARHFFPSGPPLHGQEWDWNAGRGLLIAPIQAIPPKDQLARLLQGLWAQPGLAKAWGQVLLHTHPAMAAPARYFNLHWRDRTGRIYAGMRLADVWNSGEELEISDVEAVAWLRTVALENRVRSPIPKRMHGQIYERIRDSFQEWHEYHQLRLALATALDPGQVVSPLYASLGLEINLAWRVAAWDPQKMAEILTEHSDRPSFFGTVLTLAKETPPLPPPAPNLSSLMREAVIQVAREEGLLGLGRR